MHRHIKLLTAVAALSAVCAAPALAQPTLAAGVNVGTVGVGAQLEAQVSDMFVIRGAVDGFSLNHNEDYSGVNYHGKAKLFTGGVFADVHPAASPLFVSGGAYFGDRRLDLTAKPTGNVTVGGVSYTAAQAGQINGKAKLSKFQPFAGVGYDNTFTGDRAWGFRALLGVSFSGKPDVSLASTNGTLSADATFQANLRAQEAKTEHDARDFRYFPVVQVGVTRRF